jgi:aminoglycoside phosphotransferase family enzyme
MSIKASNEPIPSVDLDSKVAFLKQPDVYPDNPRRVDTLETHTSWLFLTDHRVYKLKKPLQYDYLDFSTVEARRRNCQAEVRLNRRLTQDVYLGSVPLVLDRHHRLQLEGDGQSVEWLVKMRRLEGGRELELRLKQGTVENQDIIHLARLLADFYETSAPIPLEESAYRGRFERDIESNIRELQAPEFELPRPWLDDIAQRQLGFLAGCAGLLSERVQTGRIIEAHGDLRPEHIYLGPRPVIIDCLEFNREFRILDCADELAFLAMECERLHAPFVGEILFDTYRRATSDDPPNALIHFYMSYRALLWAKLAILHIRRHATEERPKWVERTHSYLHLADNHMKEALKT